MIKLFKAKYQNYQLFVADDFSDARLQRIAEDLASALTENSEPEIKEIKTIKDIPKEWINGNPYVVCYNEANRKACSDSNDCKDMLKIIKEINSKPKPECPKEAVIELNGRRYKLTGIK
jgi:hypothetical protein